MALNCCSKCRAFNTCVTKWYRGEKGEEDICCDVCNLYRECLKKEFERLRSMVGEIKRKRYKRWLRILGKK